MSRILIFNGPAPTTTQVAPVTTGTALKTMLQVQPSATKTLKIVEWGCSVDGFAAATPIKWDLIETDVAATVTASAAADLIKLDGSALLDQTLTTNLIQVGTANTGYTSTSEGTITATRLLDLQLIAPTNQFVRQFQLGFEPILQTGKFLRIRCLAPAAVNAYCYVIVEL